MADPIESIFDNEKSVDTSRYLLEFYRKRRSTRFFASKDIDIELIKNAISIAGTAPNGANKQPWSFLAISDSATQMKVRELAETEERIFYHKKAPSQWINDLKPLGTNATKEFLTQASYLIPIFSRTYDLTEQNEISANYYVKESVGIATGFLISALHMSGLATLTYTPSSCQSFMQLFKRPKNEKLYMILAVGLPSLSVKINPIAKKDLDQIFSIFKL